MTTITVPIVSVFILRGPPSARKVLLMRRVNPPVGAWCQVAGKIEPNETAWAAALRELREETGLTPESFWSADSYEQFYEADRDQMTVGPCFVAFVGQDVVPKLNAEHDTFGWFGFEAAVSLVSFPGQRRVLREIAETFCKSDPHPLLKVQV